MGIFTEKIKEVAASVLPVTLFVIILHFVATPLPGAQIGQFILGAFLILIGLSIFLVGVDLGATPIGRHSGRFLVGTGKLPILLSGGLILGFLISIAEPDLQILASQVQHLTHQSNTKRQQVLIVSIGVG